MANPEHLRILKQGVEVWNAWREQSPHMHPDLRGLNLRESKAHLAKVNFSTTHLSVANLREANLRGAILDRANLTDANLTNADLSGANLFRADLFGTDLSGANLYKAKLSRANLTSANLALANVQEMLIAYTVFSDTNLTGVQGLDQCTHEGPSMIDHRTLAKSGDLPTEFLRGCGLPDNFIDYLPSLLDKPFEYHSCFISYSTKNDDFAHKLHDDLQEAGVRCWFAPEDVKIGDRVRSVIEDAIRLHDKLVLILSKHSIKSEWVKDEVEAALEKERKRKQTVLFPIRLDDSVMDTRQAWASKLRRQRHIGDFRQWIDPDKYAAAFQRLLRDLRAGK